MSDVLAALGAVWNWILFLAIVGGGVLGLGWLKHRNAQALGAAARRRREQAIDDEIHHLLEDEEQ